MLNVGRVSTGHIYNSARDTILRNQAEFAHRTAQLNTGQRFLDNYSQYNGTKDLAAVTGDLAGSKQRVENYTLASSELGLAETVLNNMKDLLDTVKVDALQGSSDTYGEKDLEILGGQLRSLGENLYLLANTKLGERHIFGGLDSDKKVIDFSINDLFSNAEYNEGDPELGDRQIDGLQSSVSLSDLFDTQATTAQVQGTAFTTPLAAPAQINLTVNDGTQDIYVGDINFNAGDSLAAIITTINTAFNTAGGQGSIVQDGGGFLEFDTALATGNVANSAASVIVSQGIVTPGTLNDLGLTQATVFGTSRDLRQTLGELDSAYFSGDNDRVRIALADVEANLSRVVAKIADIGNLNKQFDELVDRESYQKEVLELKQADIAQIPVAEAAQKLNAAQTVYSYTLQFSSRIMEQSIFDFVSL